MKANMTVVVTGATGLIGGELCRALIADGWTAIGVARDAGRLEALHTELGAGQAFVPYPLDLATADFDAFARDLAARGLRPSGLVNNARDVGNLAGAHPWPTAEAWRAEFEIGVVRPVALIAALAGAQDSALESVVNVASIYGVVAVNTTIYDDPAKGTPLHYGPVKAALIAATRELAVRLAPRVRVNAVSYGGVGGRAPADFVRRYSAMTPQGRMLDPADTAGAVKFLLSDGARATTGHNLMADGGWIAW